MSRNKVDTVVGFVLDESGSMEEVRAATVSGFNEYLGSLKNDETPTLLSLWSFNSGGVKTLYDFEDVSSVPEMSVRQYRPNNLTPLYDSIAKGIYEIQVYLNSRKGNWNVIFTIMTDGYENSSQMYSRREIIDLIQEKEKEGWVFMYLGANQEAWEVAESMGIRREFASKYEATNPEEALRTTAASTMRSKASMRRGNRPSKAFTSSEMERMMEKKGVYRRR
tara:strand:+ start:1098 stop:1763 length:666 start_codon:yes stop_codon:yes gene_type:complete